MCGLNHICLNQDFQYSSRLVQIIETEFGLPKYFLHNWCWCCEFVLFQLKFQVHANQTENSAIFMDLRPYRFCTLSPAFNVLFCLLFVKNKPPISCYFMVWWQWWFDRMEQDVWFVSSRSSICFITCLYLISEWKNLKGKVNWRTFKVRALF